MFRRDRWTSGLLSIAFVLAAAAAAEAQSITLASGKSFHQGDQTFASTVCPDITISCGGGFWNTANGIRLVIPSTVNLTWDTSVTNPTYDKTNINGGNVGAVVSYPTSKVCLVPVTTNFTFGPPASVVIIKNLRFIVGSPLPTNSGFLGANYAGGNTQLITDGVNALTIFNNPTISSGGSYSVSPPGPTAANMITITEASSSPGIRTATDLRITIPPSLNMTWNTGITTPVFGGVSGKVNGIVSYDNNRTLRINVTTNFLANDVLTVSGLQFTSITTDSSGQLFATTNSNAAPLTSPNDANDTDSSTISILGLPTISSFQNQAFTKGDPSTLAQDITITESAGTPKVTTTGIRITIPAGFNMTWDTSIANANVSGSARTAGHIALTPAVSYSNGNRTVLIPVLSTFGSSQQAIINGLRFMNFTNASAVDNLELDINGDLIPENVDIRTIAIGAPTISSGGNQVFNVADPPTNANLITITDGTPTRITALNDIRIKIPAGFNMDFDTTRVSVATGLTFGGTGLVHAAQTITYIGTKTAVVNINTDFLAGQTLTINGLRFQNFSAPSTPQNLQLEVNNAGTNCNVDPFFIAVGGAPSISSLSNQAFAVNDTATGAVQITITDANGFPSITAANGIDIRIPVGYPMQWNTAITTAPPLVFGGTGAGHVTGLANKVSYPNVRTAHIILGSDFLAGQTLTVTGLQFQNFSAAAAPTNLQLFVDPVGSAVPDDKTIGIGRPTIAISTNQTLGVGDPSTLLNPLTITEDGTVPRIRSANGIRVVIPAGLQMEFDQTIQTLAQGLSFTGSGAGHVSAGPTIVTYPSAKVALIALATNFAAGEVLNVSGLKLTNFTGVSGPLGLGLNVSNLGTVCHVSAQTITIGARPQLLSVVTRDTNGNGSIDHLVLTFDKNIDPATTSVTSGIGFSIVTPTYSIGAGSCSGAVVTFTLVEKGTPDTGVRPSVIYDPMVGNLQDLAGLTTNFTGPMLSNDGAAPVVTGVSTSDGNGNGHLNTITITFSEPLQLGQEDIADWKIIDADGSTDLLQGVTTGNILIANTSSSGSITFTLPDTIGTTGTPRFLYSPNLNGQEIRDLATTPNAAVLQTNCSVPVVDAGPDFAVGPSKVKLDASRSYDLNGQPLTYNWNPNGSPFGISDSTSATPFFLGTTAGFYTYTVTVSNLLVSASADVVVQIVNVPPGADAGSNQTVDPGTSPVYLVALASSDANGETLNGGGLIATWQQIGGKSVGALNPVINGVVDFTAPAPSVPPAAPDNILTFEVTISDGVNQSKATTQVLLNGAGPVVAPTADAGPDQVVLVNTDVQLDGSRSVDPGGLPLTYLWTATFPLSSTTAVKPTFHPVLPGLYTLSLSVTNNAGVRSLPSTVRILVQSPTNQAPVAEAHRLLPTGEIIIGDLVVLDGTGSRDPEGKPVSYAWLQTAGPAVILSDPSALRPTFTPVLDATYTFQLTVGDGSNLSLPASVSLTVKSQPTDVTFTTSIAYGAGIPPSGHALLSTGTLFLNVNTSDLPNTWFWYLTQTEGPAGIINSASNRQLLFPFAGTTYSFTPPSAGTYSFTLAATTFNAIRAYATISFIVDNTLLPDLVPKAVAAVVGSASVTAGTTVTLDASGSQNLPALTAVGLRPYWAQKEGPPVALSDPYAMSPTFTPSAAGQYTFELVVADTTSQSQPSFAVVTVTPAASSTVPSGGGGGGGCGILGMEWMLLLPALWLASWVRNRVRARRVSA